MTYVWQFRKLPKPQKKGLHNEKENNYENYPWKTFIINSFDKYQ